MIRQPYKIWCLLRDQQAHVLPVEKEMRDRAVFIHDTDWNPEILVKERPDLVLCVNDFPFDIARCLDAARAENIPSLVLQDGVLEWRCQYENPLFAAGGGAAQHQPVLADKIACLGAQSARQIALWGNAAKVEVTGMPRLDEFRKTSIPASQLPGRRILVMTSKKPWFDEGQKEVSLRALKDTRDFLAKQPGLQVIWRLTKDVSSTLQVENNLRELDSMEMAGILARVDAVIAMPGTAILEAMLSGRPVAALDYHNVPRFVPTAWTISAPGHFDAVVREILEPSAAKKMFQEHCLHDCLRLDGKASSHAADLIEKMIEVSREQRKAGKKLCLPANLLQAEAFPGAGVGAVPVSVLYPAAEVYAVHDTDQLKARLARAENENRRLKEKLKSRGPGFWLEAAGRYLASLAGRGNPKA